MPTIQGWINEQKSRGVTGPDLAAGFKTQYGEDLADQDANADYDAYKASKSKAPPQPIENAADFLNTVARNLSGVSPAAAKHLADQAPQMAADAVRNPPAPPKPRDYLQEYLQEHPSTPEPEPAPPSTSTQDQPLRAAKWNLPRTLVGFGDALMAEPLARKQLAEDKARGWTNPTVEKELQATKIHGFMEKNAEAMDANKQAREDASVSGNGVGHGAKQYLINARNGVGTIVKSIVNLADQVAGIEFAPDNETDQQHAEKILGELETMPGQIADMARGFSDFDGSNTLLTQPVEAWLMLLDPALKTLRTVPKFAPAVQAIDASAKALAAKIGAKVPEVVAKPARAVADAARSIKGSIARGFQEGTHQGTSPEDIARQHEIEKIVFDPDVNKSATANAHEMARRRVAQGGVELVQPDLEPAELRIKPPDAEREALSGERAIDRAETAAGQAGGRLDAAQQTAAEARDLKKDVGRAQTQATQTEGVVARASTDIDKLLDQQANPAIGDVVGGKLSNRMGDLPRVQSAADKASAAVWDMADTALPLAERLAKLAIPKIAKEEIAASRVGKVFDAAQKQYEQAAREAKVDPSEFAKEFAKLAAEGVAVAAEKLAAKQVASTPTTEANAAAKVSAKMGKSGSPRIFSALKNFKRAQDLLAKEVGATVERIRAAAGRAGQAGVKLAETVKPIDATTTAGMAKEVARMQHAPARAAERAATEARVENAGAGERPEVRAGTVYVPEGTGAYGVIKATPETLAEQFKGTPDSTLHDLSEAAAKQSRLKHVVDQALGGRNLESFDIEADPAAAAKLGLPNGNFYEVAARRARDLTSRNITDPAEMVSSVKQLIDRTQTPLDTIRRIDQNAGQIADWLLAEAETQNHSNRLNVEQGVISRPVPTVTRMRASLGGPIQRLRKFAGEAGENALVRDDAKIKYEQDLAAWQERQAARDDAGPSPDGLPSEPPDPMPEAPASLGTSADRAARKEINQTQDRQLLRDEVGAPIPEAPKPFLTTDPKVNEALAHAAKVFKESAYHLERLFPEWGSRELTPERLMQRMLEPLLPDTTSLMRVRQVRDAALKTIGERAKAAGVSDKAISLLKQEFADELTAGDKESAISKNRFVELDAPDGTPLFRVKDYHNLVDELPANLKAEYQAKAMQAISRTMGNAQYAQHTLGAMAAELYKFFAEPTKPGTVVAQANTPGIQIAGRQITTSKPMPKALDPDVPGEIGQYALNLAKGVLRDKQPVMLIPYEGKLLATVFEENLPEFAAKLKVPIEEVRALADKLRTFKSSPSMNAALKRISSQQFKGMDAPPELVNMHGHPTALASLESHINSLSVLDELDSAGLLTEAIKGSRTNLVARSAAALINNDISNFIQSIVTRADPRTPGDLVLRPMQLKAVLDGTNRLPNGSAVPPQVVKQMKALAGTSLFNSSKLSRDIGETNMWKALQNAMPEKTARLERLARDVRDTSKSPILRAAADLPNKLGDINGHLENSYSVLGDQIYKTEHAMAHSTDSYAKLDMLEPGSSLTLQTSPVRKIVVTRHANGGFELADSRNASIAIDGAKQVAPDVNALDKAIAEAAYHATEKLFFDAQRGGNIPKYARAKGIQPLVGIFSWAFRSADIPFLKQGLGYEILRDGFERETNSPAVQAMQIQKGQSLAIRRVLLVGMAGVAFADQRKLAALSRAASYNPAMPGALVAAGADPGYMDVQNTENTNFLGSTGSVLGLSAAAINAVTNIWDKLPKDPDDLKAKFANPDGPDDFEGPMQLGHREQLRRNQAQILRNQANLRSAMRGEIADVKQLAGLFGATGAPIITTASRFMTATKDHPFSGQQAIWDFSKELFGSTVTSAVNAGLGGVGELGHMAQSFRGHPMDAASYAPLHKLGDALDYIGDFSAYGLAETKQGVKGNGLPQSSEAGYLRWAFRTLSSFGARTVYLGNQGAENPKTGKELFGLIAIASMRAGDMIKESMIAAAEKQMIKARTQEERDAAKVILKTVTDVVKSEKTLYQRQLENQANLLFGIKKKGDPTQEEIDATPIGGEDEPPINQDKIRATSWSEADDKARKANIDKTQAKP